MGGRISHVTVNLTHLQAGAPVIGPTVAHFWNVYESKFSFIQLLCIYWIIFRTEKLRFIYITL